MTYDPVTQRTLLFGGGGVAYGDTWACGGKFWTQIGRFGPSARFGHSLDYDTARNRAVLFGVIFYMNALPNGTDLSGVGQELLRVQGESCCSTRT